VAQHTSHKLSFKFFGPYQVLKKVGNVSYKLKLPESSKIHHVIHVSQLKKAVRPEDQVSADLPVTVMSVQDQVQPVKIYGEWLIRQGNKQVPQILLQWEGLPTSCNTWELLYVAINKFPLAPSWGQAGTP
jgi:hypothetical protein